MDNHSFQDVVADATLSSTMPARGSRQQGVIAGAGIIGSSIAYHLARRGAQVTLLEKGEPAGGTTEKSFAWINATFSKQPWHYFLLKRDYQHQTPFANRAFDHGQKTIHKI